MITIKKKMKHLLPGCVVETQYGKFKEVERCTFST